MINRIAFNRNNFPVRDKQVTFSAEKKSDLPDDVDELRKKFVQILEDNPALKERYNAPLDASRKLSMEVLEKKIKRFNATKELAGAVRQLKDLFIPNNRPFLELLKQHHAAPKEKIAQIAEMNPINNPEELSKIVRKLGKNMGAEGVAVEIMIDSIKNVPAIVRKLRNILGWR